MTAHDSAFRQGHELGKRLAMQLVACDIGGALAGPT